MNAMTCKKSVKIPKE